MSQQDLETYQVQLEQVDEALKADPNNEEFKSLRSELKQLITLTEQAIAVASASSGINSQEISERGHTTRFHCWRRMSRKMVQRRQVVSRAHHIGWRFRGEACIFSCVSRVSGY
jgi:uncharacterized protein HemX